VPRGSAGTAANRQAWITSRDIAILAAVLGFVDFAIPLLPDLVGVLDLAIRDPSSRQVLLFLALTLLDLFWALGVVAAWQSKPVLAWVVGAGALALWLLGWRHFVILAPGPFLFILSAVLTTVVRKRKPLEEAGSD
jgi:hypothetical protein